VSQPTPARPARRPLPPNAALNKPASPRHAALRLIAASLLLGLLLISLDITPSTLMVMAEDAGPVLRQWGRNIWRGTEIVVGCLLAGGALVLPYWLVKRWRKSGKGKPTLTAVPQKPAAVPSEMATLLASADPVKPAPVTKLP
jgi:hypothetical protein